MIIESELTGGLTPGFLLNEQPWGIIAAGPVQYFRKGFDLPARVVLRRLGGDGFVVHTQVFERDGETHRGFDRGDYFSEHSPKYPDIESAFEAAYKRWLERMTPDWERMFGYQAQARAERDRPPTKEEVNLFIQALEDGGSTNIE